jgi:hypothetical protein
MMIGGTQVMRVPVPASRTAGRIAWPLPPRGAATDVAMPESGPRVVRRPGE